MMNRRLTYNTREVAARLGISPTLVVREARAGKIPYFQFGSRFVFPKKAIDRMSDATGLSLKD
ncbi:MAG: helix-turn-helix domain-containing protein [Planctomycetota bacterium]|jgi:excisionase family DNA binding protein